MNSLKQAQTPLNAPLFIFEGKDSTPTLPVELFALTFDIGKDYKIVKRLNNHLLAWLKNPKNTIINIIKSLKQKTQLLNNSINKGVKLKKHKKITLLFLTLNYLL